MSPSRHSLGSILQKVTFLAMKLLNQISMNTAKAKRNNGSENGINKSAKCLSVPKK
jgi:hypothetical protein